MAFSHAVTRIDVARADDDRQAVHAGHTRRLAQLDPLVRVAPVSADEAVLFARSGDGAAMGRLRVVEVAPDSEDALWGALRRFQLTPYLLGSDAPAAWERLLARWDRTLRDQVGPGDDETAAGVQVASRDLAVVRPLTRHGFAPLQVVAVRHGQPRHSLVVDDRVRRATMDDVDGITELSVALHRHDASFGVLSLRPATARLLRAGVTHQIEQSPTFTWVADGADGRITGYLAVEPPEQAAWISPLVSGGPTAYLQSLYVRPAGRRGGIGAALVATAHRALDGAGVEVTVLHHALPSPVSTPFWARHGYRPLLTNWYRRPAVAAPTV